MSLRPNTSPPIQDMPPAGGYAEIKTGRYIPPRGPRGWQVWLGTSAVMMFGFYRVGQGNREGVEQKVEERKVRYALAPLLQAESDKELLKREQQNLNREAEVMKDVPGWKVGAGVYNNGKWMPRAVAPLQHSIK